MPKGWWFHHYRSNAFHKIIECLQMAQETISILSPNVIDSCVWDVLERKLKSGVKILIVTNRRQNHTQTFFEYWQRRSRFI